MIEALALASQLRLAIEIRVETAAEIRETIQKARPGWHILIAPGEYPGGFHFSDIKGEAGAPIVIRAADRANPPKFVGGTSGFQFSSAEHVFLEDLTFERQTGNGLNFDDGGDWKKPSKNIRMWDITVRDLPKGNHDAVKLSGVTQFLVKESRFERWGGSGVDMVGCSMGGIQDCTFIDGGSNGVQIKGGSSTILVNESTFINPGERGVNLGGSTGLQFFRPPIDPSSAEQRWEAHTVGVNACTFEGGTTAVAYVGATQAAFAYNWIRFPKRWAFRILKENRNPGFKGAEKGEFYNNTIVFSSDKWASGGVNVGDGCAPETFHFSQNWWYCSDKPEMSRPNLPVPEADGTYGVNPDFDNTAPRPSLQAGTAILRPSDPTAILDLPDRASLTRLLEANRPSRK